MTTDGTDTWKTYWINFAEAFAAPLKAGGLLKEFTTNTAVTGAYAEAWIRSMVASMLDKFRVSTGAIIRPMDRRRSLRSVPQCDIIVWDPSELPALFEKGGFALVPSHSARAVIEVKRTCSNFSKFQKQLKRQQACLTPKFRSNVLGIVISHNTRLFTAEVTPDWLRQRCREDPLAITRLLPMGKDSVDVDGVFAFVYFLAQIAGHSSTLG